MGTAYRDFLVECIAKGARGSADLVAYFFLRAFDLLRSSGGLGLLAVNTIAEGDTRQVGLERLIKEFGATIYAAFPNEPWPGKAAVVTSRVHICKKPWEGKFILGQLEVQRISAFLSDQDEWTPQQLTANANKSFIASYILGLGFTLSEHEARRMIEKDPRNTDVLFPYLNGKDLNTDSQQRASRWVINFWDWSEEKAQEYRDPYLWVLEKVKPERQRRKENGNFQLRKPLPQRWWQYAEKRPALYHAIGRGHSFTSHPVDWNPGVEPLDRVLGITRVSKFLNVAFLPNNQIFTLDVILFAMNRFCEFAILQSNIHEVWTRKQASTQETRLRYTPSDCFETLPLPIEKLDSLDALGQAYENLRTQIMRDMRVGLTKLYNKFHDPTQSGTRFLELRDLHRQIDEAVLAAYGWDDLVPDHGFHEVDYLPETDQARFTISKVARIEVLRRLSELNRDQFDEQSQSSSATRPSKANEESVEDDEPEDGLFATGDGKG
jgi:hypothetical protein